MSTKAPSGHRRFGLLGRIGLALALVGLLPLGFAAYQLADVNRDALLEQLLRTHTVAARTSAEAIDAYLGPRRALAAAVVADPRIAADPTSPPAQAALGDALASWTELGVAGVAVLDGAGRPLLRAQRRGAGDLVARHLGGRSRAPAELVEEGGARWAILSVPRPDGGEVRLLAEAGLLDRALAPDELGDQARLLLVARDGGALVGDAADLAALPAAAREAALSARLAAAGRYRTEDGREIVAAFTFADEGRWIVLSTQPAAVAEAAARRMARRTAVAVALAAALVALLSILAWRSLVRPVRALLLAQRRLAGLSDVPDAGGTELEELRGALSALEQRARDRDALGEIFLGRYQVLEILGSGGMGTVFRGWDPRLQRPVALKTIHLEPESGTTAVGPGLLAEAIAAAQIVHPNVVAIYDAEEVGGLAFVAMEFVHGVGLDRYLEARGQVGWREAAPLGLAIARGLGAAHARALVHRDIKPGNVLLGHDGAIKIADFGLAQFVGSRSERVGQVFGTPGFLAPEALLGRPYDERCDLFSLGVILFRALSGLYPFPGGSFREVVVATVRRPAPTPDALAGLAPAALAETVCALLEKDPARRLGPVPRVIAALEQLVTEERLAWRLDFARVDRPLAADEIFRSAHLPTLSLPLVGSEER